MSDDGVYTKKQLPGVVGISMTQVDRLEKRGEFPKRVQLSGDAFNSKVGWIKGPVHDWVLKRKHKRHELPSHLRR